ncbi:MAG: DUF3592 domain-containing protein [Clostridia bacterium]|nr:DUF3592 domain-containing protein [Clostridia bacterium]
MKQASKNKRSFGQICVISLLLAGPLFLILGGCLLVAVGEHVVGAIVCIVLGAAVLLMGAIFKFLQSHPGHRLAQGILVGILSLIAGGIVCAALTAMINVGVVQPWVDLEHCRRIADNPVTVMAKVTKHSSYEDTEDGTRYQSFVTYVYDDVRYKDFLYEVKGQKEKLAPVGKTVSLQISPEDPRQQVDDLRRNSWLVCVSLPFLLAGLAVLCMLAQRTRRSKRDGIMPDRQTIEADIKVMVRSRMLRPFLLFSWLCYGFLYLRYGTVFGWIPLAIAGLCFVGWIWCMCTTIRDYRDTQKGLFELREDVLVSKEDKSDSEGSHYILCYRSGDRTWKTSVNGKVFGRAREGDVVLAVYLSNKRKPILHYSETGM